MKTKVKPARIFTSDAYTAEHKNYENKADASKFTVVIIIRSLVMMVATWSRNKYTLVPTGSGLWVIVLVHRTAFFFSRGIPYNLRIPTTTVKKIELLVIFIGALISYAVCAVHRSSIILNNSP
jgi:predicted membrane chloride channel (bestrophin family)